VVDFTVFKLNRDIILSALVGMRLMFTLILFTSRVDRPPPLRPLLQPPPCPLLLQYLRLPPAANSNAPATPPPTHTTPQPTPPSGSTYQSWLDQLADWINKHPAVKDSAREEADSPAALQGTPATAGERTPD
jgi:hypothetical protein